MCCSHTCQFSVIAALSPHFPLLSFPFTPPSFLSPSVFPLDSLPLHSYSICTSSFIIPPPSPPLFLLLSAPSLPFPLPCTPPPSVFPMDCLPIDSYCICTSLIISPPIPPYGPLYITLSLTHFHSCILNMGREC